MTANYFDAPARLFRVFRDQAALRMLAGTPGRPEEIARMTVDHVDLRECRALFEWGKK